MRIIASGLLVLSLLVVAGGCGKETCSELSPQLELTFTFTGFDLQDGRQLEIESELRGAADPSLPGHHPYVDHRIGSIPFPAGALEGSLKLLIDPGTYAWSLLNRPDAEQQLSLRLVVRVYGSARQLLAEGVLERTLDVGGCHINLSLAVTADSSCWNKAEGDPCVSVNSASWVCKCVDPTAGCDETAQGAGLRCEESSCGDGFTDRRAGELCDPLQSPGTCTDNCLPSPVDLEVSDTNAASALGVIGSGLRNTVTGDSLVRGFYDLSYASDATDPEALGSLLIADIDGDSADELVWAMLEGIPFNQSEPVGKVLVADWPVSGERAVGPPEASMATIKANAGQTPYWLGASLAAGDLDGDGAGDLIVGAPLRETAAGAVFVAFGGLTNVITPSADGDEITLDGPTGGNHMILRGLQPSTTASPEIPGSHFGYAAVSADLDGDGLADLAVGAPGESSAQGEILEHGAVYVFPGGASEWALSADVASDEIPHLVLVAPTRTGARLGVTLAMGDLDGDGFTDLVVGSQPNRSPGQAGVHGAGAAYVLFGGPMLFSELPRVVNVEDDPPDSDVDLLPIPGTAATNTVGLGGTVSTVDLDGDGRSELAATLGRRGSDVLPWAVTLIQGQAFSQYRAEGRPIDLTTDLVRLEGRPGSGFGTLLHAADVNGDEATDLVIGAPRSDAITVSGATALEAGAIYIVLGTMRAGYWDAPSHDLPAAFLAPSLADVSLPLIRLRGGQTGGFFGISVAVSSHLGLATFGESSRFTYILEPGWTDDVLEPGKGRIWGLRLQRLLSCGASLLCDQ